MRAQALVRLVNHKLKNGDKANDRNPFEIKKGLEVPLIRLHACCTVHAARCMLHVQEGLESVSREDRAALRARALLRLGCAHGRARRGTRSSTCATALG